MRVEGFQFNFCVLSTYPKGQRNHRKLTKYLCIRCSGVFKEYSPKMFILAVCLTLARTKIEIVLSLPCWLSQLRQPTFEFGHIWCHKLHWNSSNILNSKTFQQKYKINYPFCSNILLLIAFLLNIYETFMLKYKSSLLT